MGQGSGIREVAWIDIAGGGQVVLDGNYAYVGHMQPPHGTSVLDVSRSGASKGRRFDRHSAGAAFPQGAGGERHHGGEPRAYAGRQAGR